MRMARLVFAKELTDAIRDRRTLITIVVSALLMGPLTMVLLANFLASMEEKSTMRQVYVDGIEHAPAFANFLARNDVRVLTPPGEYEKEIRSGTFQEAVIVIDAEFADKLAHGEMATVRLLFDDSRSDAQPSIRRAEALLQGYGRELTLLRVAARGITPQLLSPVSIERRNTATPKQQGASLLFLIPMFALLGAIVGSMSAAIDTTAGERERGSLEPLLTNPVTLPSLVVGKWLAVALQACVVVLATLTSFAIAAALIPNQRLATLFQFGPSEVARFALLVLPFAAMIASVLMLIATFGRTYKEAQTYAGYVALIVNFVPLITVFTTVRYATWQLFVPALAQQMMLARVLRGDAVSPIDFLVPLAIAALVTTSCLIGLTRLLSHERIVFGR